MKVHVHALCGAALGAVMGRPGPAFAAGVASHVLLDMLPHNDHLLPWDHALTAASLAGIAAVFGPFSAATWGAIGGVAPDGEHFVFRGPQRRKKAFPAHTARSRLRHGPKATRPMLSGALALGSLAALLLLRRIRSR